MLPTTIYSAWGASRYVSNYIYFFALNVEVTQLNRELDILRSELSLSEEQIRATASLD